MRSMCTHQRIERGAVLSISLHCCPACVVRCPVLQVRKQKDEVMSKLGFVSQKQEQLMQSQALLDERLQQVRVCGMGGSVGRALIRRIEQGSSDGGAWAVVADLTKQLMGHGGCCVCLLFWA